MKLKNLLVRCAVLGLSIAGGISSISLLNGLECSAEKHVDSYDSQFGAAVNLAKECGAAVDASEFDKAKSKAQAVLDHFKAYGDARQTSPNYDVLDNAIVAWDECSGFMKFSSIPDSAGIVETWNNYRKVIEEKRTELQKQNDYNKRNAGSIDLDAIIKTGLSNPEDLEALKIRLRNAVGNDIANKIEFIDGKRYESDGTDYGYKTVYVPGQEVNINALTPREKKEVLSFVVEVAGSSLDEFMRTNHIDNSVFYGNAPSYTVPASHSAASSSPTYNNTGTYAPVNTLDTGFAQPLSSGLNLDSYSVLKDKTSADSFADLSKTDNVFANHFSNSTNNNGIYSPINTISDSFNRPLSEGFNQNNINLKEKKSFDDYKTGNSEIDSWANTHYNSTLYNSDLSNYDSFNYDNHSNKSATAFFDADLAKLDPTFAENLRFIYTNSTYYNSTNAISDALTESFKTLKNIIKSKAGSPDEAEYRRMYDLMVGRFYPDQRLDSISRQSNWGSYGSEMVKTVNETRDFFKEQEARLGSDKITRVNDAMELTSADYGNYYEDKNGGFYDLEKTMNKDIYDGVGSSNSYYSEDTKVGADDSEFVKSKKSSSTKIGSSITKKEISPKKAKGKAVSKKNFDANKKSSKSKLPMLQNKKNIKISPKTKIDSSKSVLKKQDLLFKNFQTAVAKNEKNIIAKFSKDNIQYDSKRVNERARKKTYIQLLRNALLDKYSKLNSELFNKKGSSKIEGFDENLSSLKRVSGGTMEKVDVISNLVGRLNDSLENYVKNSPQYSPQRRLVIDNIKRINTQLKALSGHLELLLNPESMMGSSDKVLRFYLDGLRKF